MPDDFVLNVRQISQYAQQPAVGANANVLVQLNGMGGPYGAVDAATLVSSALSAAGLNMDIGGDLVVGARLTVGAGLQTGAWIACGSGISTVDDVDVGGGLSAARDITVGGGIVAQGPITMAGQVVATQAALAQLAARPFVSSVSGRTGAILLTVDDVSGAAPAFSPFLGGSPRAETPPRDANDGEIATAQWVRGFLLDGNAVASFNGRRGAVKLRLADVLAVGGAPAHSPELRGRPKAPTPPGSDSSDRLATTKFVQWAIAEGGMPGPVGPKGPPGPPGTGFTFRGTVATAGDLPPTGNEVSDLFVALDTNTGYVWGGANWQPIGIITPSARVYVSDNAPVVTQDGDLWFSSSTGELFVYYEDPTGGQWVIANTGVQGSQGPQGDPGPPGPNVSIGTSQPLPPELGMLWYNPTTEATQIYTTGGWRPVSAPSATVSVGTTQPAGAVEGDLWFDTSSTGELMVRMQGFWIAAASGIEGPQGPTGNTGLQGNQGIQGVQGPPGSGIQFRGDQANLAAIQALPSPNPGDAWIALDTTEMWVWNGSQWNGPYPMGGGIPEAPTPGIYGRENGGWTQLSWDDGVFV